MCRGSDLGETGELAPVSDLRCGQVRCREKEGEGRRQTQRGVRAAGPKLLLVSQGSTWSPPLPSAFLTQQGRQREGVGHHLATCWRICALDRRTGLIPLRKGPLHGQNLSS